jgi:molybdenum cofactor cytidylyltransferase
MNLRSDHDIGAIILAAGNSSRFGDENKLLAKFGEKTVIESTINNIAKLFKKDAITIVLRNKSQLPNFLKFLPYKLTIVLKENFGISDSIKQGLNNFITKDGVMICLGDMPGVSASTYSKIRNSLCEQEDKIIIPLYKGIKGNPIGIPRKFYSELKTLSGDVGFKQLFSQLKENISFIEIDDRYILKDIDTKKDLLHF